MRKISIILFFAALSLNCGSNTENSNKPNNTPTATPTVANTNTNSNANTANTNVANANVKKEEPVPAFTDAKTALIEGNKYYDANETDKAAEAFKQAIKLDPDLPEAHFKLGVIYALSEKEKETQPVKVEETPTPTNKKNAKVNPKVAPKKESDKEFEEAVKGYKKILAKNPKDDNALYNLARAYNKLNMDKEAQKAIQDAVKIKPDDTDYQTELGAILIKFAKYEDALKVLQKAVKIDPNNSQAQDLIEKAQAGKKRTDYGIPKDKQKNQ